MGVARGRHAPPLAIRLPRQRQRLLVAAAGEFAEHGYRGTSSDSISRRASMSKATFYTHFADKEQCMLAVQEHGTEVLLRSISDAAHSAPRDDARARIRASVRAFLTVLAEEPELAQTVLVEIIGAGPRAAQRRDDILQRFADRIDDENRYAADRGLIRRFASAHDAMAIVGGIVELVSRQVRLETPPNMLDLAPVLERLILGVLGDSDP